MAATPPLRIAIIGGGLGGVALAIALSKHAHLKPTIYEARASFREYGAGIGILANARSALRHIDPRIVDAVSGVTAFDDYYFEYVVAAKGPLEDQSVVKVPVKDRTYLGTAHRANVLDVLLQFLPESVRTEFDKRLVSADRDMKVLSFADGSTAETDLIVGCDGMRSVCRKLVFSESAGGLADAHFTKMVAYRGLIPMADAEEVLGSETAHGRFAYLGHAGHIITFPVAHGTLMNVVAFHKRETWDSEHVVQPDQQENVRRDFDASRWTEKAVKIIEMIKDPSAWAIFHHPSTPTFHSDDNRIVLVGDAAHTMTPHYGQGAGMAFEDALVLAGLLGQCHVPADIHKALHAYDLVRLPRANKIVERSFVRCEKMCLKHMGNLSEGDLPQLIKDWDYTPDWIWHEDLEAHLDGALREFHKGE